MSAQMCDAVKEPLSAVSTRSNGLRGWAMSVLVLALAVLAAGCPARGIGDPCVPENVPGDGFDSNEIYIETSSVQCRTNACLVYRFEGDPRSATVDPVSVRNQVFCSCRCSANEDTTLPLCACSDGFHCVNVLNQGGAGVAGGYCLPNAFCESDDDCRVGSNRCATSSSRCEGNRCTNTDTESCNPGIE